MLDNHKYKKACKKLDKKYQEWLRKGMGTGPEYMGMTNQEFTDWHLYKIVPGRFL